MSSEKNSRRINLCFKLSSPDQQKAHKILLEVENKTQYITDLILSNNDIAYEAKGSTTKELLKEALLEILPDYLANHPVGRPTAAAVEAPETVESVFEEDIAVAEEDNEKQHPQETSAVEEYEVEAEPVNTDNSDAEDLGVDSTFLDGLMSLMGDF